MTLDKFTIKAQEAIQEAVNIAMQHGQQAVEPVHLLKGIIAKGKDVFQYVTQKVGANASQIEMLAEQEIQHLPRVQGGQQYLSGDSQQLVQNAMQQSQQLGDEFVALESLLIAMLETKSTASRILKDAD